MIKLPVVSERSLCVFLHAATQLGSGEKGTVAKAMGNVKHGVGVVTTRGDLAT